MLRNIKKRLVGGFMAVVMTISNATPFRTVPADLETEDTTTEIVTESETENLTESETETETETETEDTELCHQSFELRPNDEESEKTVTLQGLMPEGAEATAVDVSEEHEGIAAYDITITDGEKEYQPNEENPILVEISDPSIPEDGNIELWHIKDDGEREQIFDFTAEEGKISFYATGFSVYEIVKPIQQQDLGFFDLLAEHGDEGFYVSFLFGGKDKPGFQPAVANNGQFYLDGTSKKINNQGDRKGIGLTQKNVKDNAVKMYFDRVENTNNNFYLYIKENDASSPKYIKMYTGINFGNNGSSNASRSALDYVETETEATAFVLEKNSTDNQCKIYAKLDDNQNHYWVSDFNNPETIVGYKSGSNNNAWITVHGLTDDPYKLNDKTYGLMNYNGGTMGYALMADTESKYYAQLYQLITRSEEDISAEPNVLYVPNNSNITLWTFESVREDIYHLSAETAGGKKYLNIEETTSNSNEGTIQNGISISDTPQEIQVIPSADGKITLKSGSYAVAYKSDNEKSLFWTETYNQNDTAQQFTFVKVSTVEPEDVMTFSAKKVSVSSVKDDTNVILYTRVWHEADKVYYFYAVDHDGTLYPIYERGDNIMWKDDRINSLLWKFTEYYWEDSTPENPKPNGYYELYNPYSRKYIAPQIVGNQVLDSKKIGINLNGRKAGDYYTTILAWDDPNYKYAGLKYEKIPGTDNYHLVSCPKSEASTFYFAVVSPPESDLTVVETLDNSKYGITMKMIDYPSRNYQKNVIGYDNTDNEYKQGLLTTDLKDNGYPNATHEIGGEFHSLKELFIDNSSYANCTVQDVNHLFIKSIYDATGYFEFDSCQNFASLKDSNDGNFTVYKELGTTESGNAVTTRMHGQFLPYNTITDKIVSTNYPANFYTALADYKNPNVGKLSPDDPRYGEKLYTVGNENQTNYYNGMELGANFVQTPNGHDAWGHDIIFEFTGDDDFWLYVDNELVIDLGGIHSALAGKVNFATGDVEVKGVSTTLKDLFYKNYLGRDGHTEEEARAYVNEIFTEKDVTRVTIENGVEVVTPGKGYVFKDYTPHSMKIFYMERGAGASNLHMRFNLTAVEKGHVTLSKSLTAKNNNGEEHEFNVDFEEAEYPFQIFYQLDGAAANEWTQLTENNPDNLVNVKYVNSEKKIRYKEAYVPPNVPSSLTSEQIANYTYENVYFINPDKAMSIAFPDNTMKYKLRECGINPDVYNEISINGEKLAFDENQPNDNILKKAYTIDYIIEPSEVDKRPQVAITNNINPPSLKTLTIKKKLFD
ncbi:MAG: hypothetical protein IKS03_00905, partial [Ruminococcus sp.]|nr:hypothetical protein [Ruminococcus sp.]